MSTEPSPSSLQLTVQELQCEFCEQPMFPPIFQCTHGHSGCSECNEKASGHCWGCREVTRTIRHPRRCRLSPLGCTRITRNNRIDRHEYRDCKYRPYTCPFFSHHYCSFAGDIAHVFTHLKDDHMVDVYEDSSFKINYRQLNLPRHNLVINSFGKQFCWHFELYPENSNKNVVVVTVRIMGEPEEGLGFRYSLKVIGNQRTLVWTQHCGSIRYSVELEFPLDGGGFIFPFNTSHFIVEGNPSLEIEGYISNL